MDSLRQPSAPHRSSRAARRSRITSATRRLASRRAARPLSTGHASGTISFWALRARGAVPRPAFRCGPTRGTRRRPATSAASQRAADGRARRPKPSESTLTTVKLMFGELGFWASAQRYSAGCLASASLFQGLLTSESSTRRDTHRQAAKKPPAPPAQTTLPRRRSGGEAASGQQRRTTHKVSTLRAFPRARGRYWCGRRPGGALAEGFSRGPRRRGAAARVGGSRFTPAVPVTRRTLLHCAATEPASKPWSHAR